MTPRNTDGPNILTLLLLGMSLFWVNHINAQNFPPDASKVYNDILQLKKDEVNQALDQWDTYPISQAHFSNYMIFFELFIQEDKESYEAYYPEKEKLLSQIIENGDRSDPLYLYAQADIYLQWALIEAKFRDFFYAFRDVRKAYSLLEENHRKFPGFLPNKKNMGVMIALVGTLPGKYQWGFEWVSGIPGDIDLGKSWIAEAAARDHFFRDEAIAINSFFLIHVIGDEEAGWDNLRSINMPAHKSPLVAFLLANLALDLKKLDVAGEILESYKKEKGQLELPQLNYYKGLLHLYRGNFRMAISYFNNFLNSFDGRHLVKSAWLHKAYCHYILGEDDLVMQSLEFCQVRGDDLVDEDAHALSVAQKGDLLPVQLLKVKLFFDGGNYEQSQQIIDRYQNVPLTEKNQKMLVYYQARIFHETGNTSQAVQHYKKVIGMPQPEWEHYAANSALQIGNILKSNENCREASHFYSLCIEIKAESYDNSLDQKAKTGLLQCQ